MELLNWVDSCYAEEEAKNSRPICFDLIDKVFKEVGLIKKEQKQREHMAEIVTLFKEAIIRRVDRLNVTTHEPYNYCYQGGDINQLWDIYEDNLVGLEEMGAGEWYGDEDEDWKWDLFGSSFAYEFVATLNTNLGSHPRDDDDDDYDSEPWHDGRYQINSIWKCPPERSWWGYQCHYWC